MQEKIDQLKLILGEIADLNHASSVLSWDQQVNMPPGGAEARGQALATLGTLSHKKFTSPETGKLLDELKREAESLDTDSPEYRLIKVTAHDFDKATRVPAEFVAESAQATTLANQAWAEARRDNDFGHFLPHLEKVIDLTRRYVTFFPPAAHPYDTMLDDYEPGMTTADVQAIFNTLRTEQVALIKAIAGRPQVDDSCLRQRFPEQAQWKFGEEVITAFGYDWKRGHQAKAPHPFCTSFGNDDVRITTRVDENFFNTMLFGTMHETGHALYDQGIGHTWERTPLASGASTAVHESQSRMWENLVGRSLPFWQKYYPRLQEFFPEQLGKTDLETFYKAINKVQPSLIRVEADEATYNLHIMLRLELEIAMLEGKIELKDLPQIWNAKMDEYLGVTPPNDAAGVLQDIHWSWGLFGYFPTYALGNLVSAQLWEKFLSINPELPDQIRQGDFSALLSWLRVKIHQYGRKYEPQELVERVTKSRITPEPYIRYLKTKYSEIYGL
jgi:carboxypeptidase Taq